MSTQPYLYTHTQTYTYGRTNGASVDVVPPLTYGASVDAVPTLTYGASVDTFAPGEEHARVAGGALPNAFPNARGAGRTACSAPGQTDRKYT